MLINPISRSLSKNIATFEHSDLIATVLQESGMKWYTPLKSVARDADRGSVRSLSRADSTFCVKKVVPSPNPPVYS